GGYGDARSAVTSALILEELAYGDLALALHLLVPRLLTIPLLVAGTEEQRKRWLPRFAGPEFTGGTAAFVEPRGGFDATSLATRAGRQGGGSVLTGPKCLVPPAAWQPVAGEGAGRPPAGRPATRAAGLVQQSASRSALNIPDTAGQVLGGHGYIREHPVELWLRNARGFATFDGLAVV